MSNTAACNFILKGILGYHGTVSSPSACHHLPSPGYHHHLQCLLPFITCRLPPLHSPFLYLCRSAFPAGLLHHLPATTTCILALFLLSPYCTARTCLPPALGHTPTLITPPACTPCLGTCLPAHTLCLFTTTTHSFTFVLGLFW